jgi:hypothetical protein
VTVADLISVPSWVLDEPHGTCNYYLLRIEGDEARADGCHSDPQDVAKARRLIESIDAITKRPGRRYVMVRVMPVPEHTGSVNRGAIDALNGAAVSDFGDPRRSRE